jgi:predicted AAA+ superfamily ATPase
MLYRKIQSYITDYLKGNSDKILILEGARQVGKSFIIRVVGQQLFKHFIELNFVEDDEHEQLFKNIHSAEDFYLTLSMVAGARLGDATDTLIFLDEIQHYPQFLTLLKFFREDNRYRFIASGSLLGISLRQTTSIPVGSIIRKEMYQLDFEEFLIANGFGDEAIKLLHNSFLNKQGLTESHHQHLLNLFRRYLLVGGMPDAVNEYLDSHNIVKVREIQNAILDLYGADAAKYEKEQSKNLLIKRIYDMIPSQMENKKKRIVAKEIQGKKGDRFNRYQEEFEYLISSGIVLDAHAISNPKFPLAESVQKNLLKLYLNDVGLLTAQLFHHNLRPVLEDIRSINLGAVYESVVAQELRSHGLRLFYYDNRQKGEVDFLVDDYDNLSILPVEVKSGKGYTLHSALNNLLGTPDYHVNNAVVLSNERDVTIRDKVIYMPVYYAMFLGQERSADHNDPAYLF